MNEDKPMQLPEKDKGYSVLERREILLSQLKCPRCGCGRLPDTRYCPSCSAELPEIQRPESPVTVDQRRWQARVLNWFVDTVPGLASPKVLVRSLLLLSAAYVVGPLIVYAFSILLGGALQSGGFTGMAGGVIFGVCICLLAGFTSIVVFMLGLLWLFTGEICRPSEFVDAFGELRRKHWVLLIAAVVLGWRLFFLIRPWRLFG